MGPILAPWTLLSGALEIVSLKVDKILPAHVAINELIGEWCSFLKLHLLSGTYTSWHTLSEGNWIMQNYILIEYKIMFIYSQFVQKEMMDEYSFFDLKW